MVDIYKIIACMENLEEDELIYNIRKALDYKEVERELKNITVEEIIAGCQEGMKRVGELFEQGEYFVGDLIFAGELMKEVLDLLSPYTEKDRWQSSGRILLGTVHGDLHDIGKNIFGKMATLAGFEVYDIGINQLEENFIQAIYQYKPDIIGLSAVLTTSIESIKRTIRAIELSNLRKSIKIIIGGSCVSKQVVKYTGADEYTMNAAKGVEQCIHWMNSTSITN